MQFIAFTYFLSASVYISDSLRVLDCTDELIINYLTRVLYYTTDAFECHCFRLFMYDRLISFQDLFPSVTMSLSLLYYVIIMMPISRQAFIQHFTSTNI